MNSEKIREITGNENTVRVATAEHQHDFPYDRSEEAQVTRREFCNFLGLTSAALFAGATAFALKAGVESRESELLPPLQIESAEHLGPGSSLNFKYPTDKDTAILIRTIDGNYYAFAQKCTHLSCPVFFDRTQQRLECPCHEGAFDAQTGAVLYGPPPRGLDVISLEIRDQGTVWAVGRTAASNERSI